MFGEVCVNGSVSTAYSYRLVAEQELVPPGVKIRPWGSNVWVDPVDNSEPLTEGQST